MKALLHILPATCLLIPLMVGHWAIALGHPLPLQENHENRMRAPGSQSSLRAPLSARREQPWFPTATREASAPGSGVFQGMLSFYRTVISPLDGDRCQMAPTCSLYGHLAIQEHGVIWGILLTADRLLHEGDEIPMALKIRQGRETYYLDTLENNTWWWWDWLK